MNIIQIRIITENPELSAAALAELHRAFGDRLYCAAADVPLAAGELLTYGEIEIAPGVRPLQEVHCAVCTRRYFVTGAMRQTCEECGGPLACR